MRAKNGTLPPQTYPILPKGCEQWGDFGNSSLVMQLVCIVIICILCSSACCDHLHVVLIHNVKGMRKHVLYRMVLPCNTLSSERDHAAYTAV